MDNELYKELVNINKKLESNSAMHSSNTSRIDEIKEQFVKLNGSVARHERDIAKLMIDVSNTLGTVNVLQKDRNATRDKEIEELRIGRGKWVSHAIWFGIFILWTLLQTTGLIHISYPF